jgi:hypothetical protein
VAPAAAPVQQTAPTQQNGGNVIVTPTPNITIQIDRGGEPRVVPGTTYSPQPKAETEPKAEPKSGS